MAGLADRENRTDRRTLVKGFPHLPGLPPASGLRLQIAARQMVKQGEGGRIVNITSVHEHTPLPDASAYTAAKHALGGLTKSMALELVKHKILVNAVAPGAIATPMNDMDDSEVKEGAMPEIPLARPGHTKEIASLVAWLCDSDASYTTGQSFIVDGGFMLANPQFKPAE